MTHLRTYWIELTVLALLAAALTVVLIIDWCS